MAIQNKSNQVELPKLINQLITVDLNHQNDYSLIRKTIASIFASNPQICQSVAKSWNDKAKDRHNHSQPFTFVHIDMSRAQFGRIYSICKELDLHDTRDFGKTKY